MNSNWSGDYEQAFASLPPVRAMQEWSEGEAMVIARQAFLDAPSAQAEATRLASARREVRGAATRRRLAGIRTRHPGLAELIDADFQWLNQAVSGFARWPFREQILHWLAVTAVGERGALTSTRGTAATWRGVREAAFCLIDWHRAVVGQPPKVAWLARALCLIQPALCQNDARGVARASKVARYMLAERKARP